MRKLDAAIAEALGREITWQRKVRTGKKVKQVYVYYACSPNDKFAQLFYAGTDTEVPKYSTDGNAMLELIGEMRKRSMMLMVEFCNKGYSATFWDDNKEEWTKDCIADTMPKTVALTAYEALTGKEWVEND